MTAYIVTITVLALAYTLYMGISNGANAVATCVTTHALKPYTAVLLGGAVMLVSPIIFCGVFGNLEVAETVGGLLRFPDEGVPQTQAFLFLLSALSSALIWAVIALIFSLPNSTSHTILGGLVGAGMTTFGAAAVEWTSVGLKVILIILAAPVVAAALAFVLTKLMRKICLRLTRGAKKYFRGAQALNVLLLSFSISVNNVQNGLGVYILAQTLIGGTSAASVPIWVVALFAFTLASGLLIGGFRLIYSVGAKIYRLNTLESYTAQLSTAVIILGSSLGGIPVSVGQLVTSGIMGVGVADRISGVRWTRMKYIFAGWLATFPIAALLGAAINAALSAIFV